MSRHIGLVVALLVATATASLTARADVDAGPVVAGEADHAALRRLMADSTEALNSLDTGRLARYLSDEFVLIFADQTVITDLAQLDGYLDTYFRGQGAPLSGVNFKPVAADTTRFIDQHTGVVHGTSTDTFTLADGSALALDTRWSATVVKGADGWRVRTFHAGVNMLDNPILDATRRTGYVLGGVGLVIGVVLGWLSMRARRSR